MLALAADQFVKQLALDTLPYVQQVPVLGDVLSLYLVRNPGAAFSFGSGATWVFTIVLAVVAVVIGWLAVTRVRSRAWAIGLGLLLGGVLGNLFDRLFREPGFGVGEVVDYINTPWMWFWTSPAIYNLADVFIVGDLVLIAVLVLLGVHMNGTRDRRDAASQSDAIAGDV